jgi:hypothetical protein
MQPQIVNDLDLGQKWHQILINRLLIHDDLPTAGLATTNASAVRGHPQTARLRFSIGDRHYEDSMETAVRPLVRQ